MGGVYSANVGGFARSTIGEAAPSTQTQGTEVSEDYSTTNIQVAGVDEGDFVKNDGKFIYTITGDKVVIANAFPPSAAKIVYTLKFDENPFGIFVNNDKLVVFGNKYYNYPYPLTETSSEVKPSIVAPVPIRYYPPSAFVYIYDISERDNPVIERNLTIDGTYINSRMIGDFVYFIVNSPVTYDGENVSLPIITEGGKSRVVPASEISYFDSPDYSYGYTTILSINTQNTEDTNNKVILMGSSQNIFVSLDNIYITYQKFLNYYDIFDKLVDKALIPNLPSDIINQINSVKSSNIQKYEQVQKIQNIYSDYINGLTSEERSNLETKLQDKAQEIYVEVLKESQKTIIHRIAIENGKIEYKTKGEVSGYVLNQFSMDEYNGYFRIATTSTNFGFAQGGIGVVQPLARTEPAITIAETTVSSIPPSTTTTTIRQPISVNQIYVLDSDLNIIGSLENIAPDETIYSARFIGNKAYLTTFRRVDPFFVIDLSDPRNPTVLGQLKIPGFSDYLHPYDENHIIGIGKEVSEGQFPLVQGVKLGLFDVSDANNPKEIAKYEIGKRGTDSEALRDHKAFLFSPTKGILVIPILLAESDYEYTWQGAYVFSVSSDSGFTLKGRITHVPTDQTTQYYYFSPYSVKRSLYIDDVLYTISDKMIKMNDLQNLNEMNSLELPYS